MFKFSYLLMALALTGSVVGPATAQPQPSQTAFKLAATPRVSDKGFSIVAPAGWEKGSPGQSAFMIYLDQAKDKFRANFNVNVSDDDGTPINKIGALVKPMFAKQFQNWQAMGEGSTSLGGQQAYWLSSRFSMQGYDIQNLQYYIRGKNKKFYVLTFTALVSNYKSYEMMFRQTAMTVQTM